MTTMRTFTCPTCGATLATSAEPGTTLKCEYCGSDFVVPAPSLDQPGDSQATVLANYRRRGNPSSMPPTAADGTPPSTPERPPDPDSPAGVGNTVDSDAPQPVVGRGPVETEAEASFPDPAAAQASPEPVVEASPEPEARTPEIIEELDPPVVVAATDPAAGATPEIQAEPEPPTPPAADPRASEMTMIAPSRVRAALGEAESGAAAIPPAPPAPALEESASAAPPEASPAAPAEPERLPVTEGASVADIIAEPTKYGAAIPATQGEPVVMGPGDVRVMPPQTPVAGGPPGAAMRSGTNRNMPVLIGGIAVLLCCVLGTCAAVFGLVPALLNAIIGG